MVHLSTLFGLLCIICAGCAKNRRCQWKDVRYDISECHTGKSGGGLIREAFAYVEPGIGALEKEAGRWEEELVWLVCGSQLHVRGQANGDARSSQQVLHLQHDGQAEALSAETRSGTWNRNLPDATLEVPFRIIDGLACDSLSWGGDSSLIGAAVLVLRGTCPFSTKTQHLEAAGAKAVIVYNNLYNRPHFIPAAAPNSTAATIPIFMVTREDGERMVTAAEDAAAEGESLQFRIPSTRCSVDRREAAPTTNHSGQSSGSSDSWEASEKGCALWAADPAGSFLYSGDNRRFHWVFSYLTYSVRFVRDGYIRFRYAVDAEEMLVLKGYDGLIFEMDGEPAGSFANGMWIPEDCSFAWVYKKEPGDVVLHVSHNAHKLRAVLQDFGTSSGEDRARLQYVPCRFFMSKCLAVPGASAVRLVAATSMRRSGAREARVPAEGEGGHRTEQSLSWCWSGQVHLAAAFACTSETAVRQDHVNQITSAGLAQCKMYRALARSESGCKWIVYRAWNGTAAPSDSIFCRGNKTMVHALWRQPKTCQTTSTADELAGITANNRVRGCPACQPFQWRPRGGSCENRPARACPAPKFALPILKVNRWEVFPANFTSWIWGRPSVEDQSHSWQLAPDGSAVEVGTAFLGGGGAEAEALLSARADQAILGLDVSLASPGALKFTLEEKPVGAWSSASAGALYVDHEPREPQEVSVKGGRLQFKLRMEPGLHWVTWVWRYTGPKLEEQAADASQQQEGSGLRLLEVSVTNALGASQSGPCRSCPPGRGLVNATECRACPPGWSTAMDGGEPVHEGCSRCPAGRASSGDRGAGSPSCKPCGRGTFSDPGASFCKPLATLGGEGRLQWSTEAILAAWPNSSQTSSGLRGVQVEDRTYYVSLLEPKRFPGISLPFTNAAAFVWEVLPPRINNDGDACESSASSLSSLRPFAETLEQVVPNEGMPAGLWLNFAGSCERMGEVTKRELHILLSCRPEARRDNLDIKLLSAMRPPSPGGCEDLALEWSTPAACPLCQEGDWEMTVPNKCDPVKGQRVTHVAPSGCRGGVPKPPDSWRPCPGVINILAFVIIGALVGCILCCLSCYVLILRRRYARYMVLEEPQVNGVAPSSIGVPDSPDPDWNRAAGLLARMADPGSPMSPPSPNPPSSKGAADSFEERPTVATMRPPRPEVLWKKHDRKAMKTGQRGAIYWVGKQIIAEDGSKTGQVEKGASYQGEWDNNEKNGYGVQVFPNGQKYEGQWANGMRNGEGTLWVPFGKAKKLRKLYVGGWKNDKRHGRGTCFFKDGQFFQGDWTQGKMNGQGLLRYSNGDLYIGEWSNGLRSGQGTLTKANGDCYEGFWLNDKREGSGSYFYAESGKVFVGEWVNDLPKAGVYTQANSNPEQATPVPQTTILPPLMLAFPNEVLDGALAAVREMQHFSPDFAESGEQVDEAEDDYGNEVDTTSNAVGISRAEDTGFMTDRSPTRRSHKNRGRDRMTALRTVSLVS
ncbi:MORN3 [Symbiodinium sp. KB8]|nr:MORN3 [Symbiodinium sp. KB8]